MTNPPPRKRFQIRLLTAVVMMFVAGALIWANVCEGNRYLRSFDNITWDNAEYGWPFTSLEFFNHINQGKPDYDESHRDYSPKYEFAIINLMIALLILFAVWFLCEWLIRHRAAQKES